MKSTIISIVLTAFITFFITKSLVVKPDECNTNQTQEEHNEISPETLQEFGVEYSIVSGGILTQTIELPGEIQVDPNRLAHITPRFDGIVKEVYKFIGQPVKTGDLLAIIESNESLSAYELRSSIDGVIIDMHFTKGETARISENYFEIADLSEVWVNLSVYQKNLSEINNNQTVMFSMNSQSVEGQISFISPTIDEHTRTAIARVILENTNGNFRPGQFISGNVILSQLKCDIVIPKSAIETVSGLTAVFREDEHGFEPVYVKIGKQNHDSVEVLSGLTLGQRYVSKGGFVLKTQMSKSSLTEAGCAH
ncbi:MAG: efflux RND transporter periplasmic adaptor subunit [Candidatus Marinimicrobia bacterium]|nr:efflux RND transporter periplasmic adaptor subunit [Candidatus Neomarinimicrobiota bacterium]MBL7023765.1 efflux RND transporter periplasmic adaptor subunit [Candidatus Neomarinimicrobiota bacterium]MBL7109402.1 efflux RND transporter periplasmic adaptor subunit [Candidatus Neomarinimicrobiota bacterium]